ncbi:MAG: hypothetical protein V2B15_07130 [Bacteroidota bacterium]
MYLIIFISVLVLTLLWILLGPVIIYMDTRENRYQLGLPGIIKAAVVPAEEIFYIRGRLFFFPFHLHPFRPKRKKSRNTEGVEKKKRSRGKRRPFKLSGGMKPGKHILAAFRVRKLDLDVDTDDFMLNAWLVPAFTAVNSERVHMQVNFEGKASLMLDVRTRLGALAWALIRTKYQSLFNY